MKITSKLEQFLKKPTLIIDTCNHGAILYMASDGLINRIADFRIHKADYSDREGFYGGRNRGGNGATTRLGAVLRPVDRSIRLDFKHAFTEHLSLVVRNYTIAHVILLAPKRFQHETIALLPKELENKLQHTISGNFFDTHPFEIISLIMEEREIAPIVTNPAASQLLKKSEETFEIARNPRKRRHMEVHHNNHRLRFA